jgi:hypothetical protein
MNVKPEICFLSLDDMARRCLCINAEVFHIDFRAEAKPAQPET